MPSPFPGMDPYLESPLYWTDFHHEMISAVRALIRARLPKGFVARVEERLYILDTSAIRSDVVVLQRPVSIVGSPFGTAVLEREPIPSDAADLPLYIRALTETVHEPFIEIVAVHEPGGVVTTVEVLSPANKLHAGNSYQDYRRKQAALLASETSLLEIDLLRGGLHTVAVPPAELRSRSNALDHLICLHRGGVANDYEVWATDLRHPLPRVAVPLTAELPDIAIDLQAAYAQAFAAGGYDQTIDYRTAPVPPFTADDALWSDSLLSEQGYR